MTEPREVPNNIEAEQALLGAILVNNEAFDRVSAFLHPEHFYEQVHAKIFEIAAKMILAGKKASPITIKPFLPSELMEGVSMPQYLARLAAEATTVINAADFGRTIQDLCLRRSLVEIGEEIAGTAIEAGVDETADKQIEEAEKALFALSGSGGSRRGVYRFSDALTDSLAMLEAAYRRDGSLSGIPTGLVDVDRLMGGLQDSDLIVIAARPGMGKTALATNIASSVAGDFSNPKPVLFFSLEMSAEQLSTRILSERTGISSSDMRRGQVHDAQYAEIREASRALNEMPLYIDDNGGIDIARLYSVARRHKRRHDTALIVVDYIQLLSGTTKRSGENRVMEITEITTRLKAMAKELGVPVIALSQLSRQVEGRDDKRPQLSDLRDSGSIEQDADVVLFIYREEYYLAKSEPKEGTAKHFEWQTEMEKAYGKADIIIAKQRHGPTGIVQVAFNARLTKFSNLAREAFMAERLL